MSTEVMSQSSTDTNMNSADTNIASSTITNTDNTNIHTDPSSLDTPTRENGAGAMTAIKNIANDIDIIKDQQQQQQETNNNNNIYNNNDNIKEIQIKVSSVKSENNPLTIAREKKIKEGTPLMVNFDERVVVHTVPYWDPCGETFYDTDDDDGPRGPNCCVIL